MINGIEGFTKILKYSINMISIFYWFINLSISTTHAK